MKVLTLLLALLFTGAVIADAPKVIAIDKTITEDLVSYDMVIKAFQDGRDKLVAETIKKYNAAGYEFSDDFKYLVYKADKLVIGGSNWGYITPTQQPVVTFDNTDGLITGDPNNWGPTAVPFRRVQ